MGDHRPLDGDREMQSLHSLRQTLHVGVEERFKVQIPESVTFMALSLILQYLLPSLCSTPLHLELGDLNMSSMSSRELFDSTEVEVVDHALVTFTTCSTSCCYGSTGSC